MNRYLELVNEWQTTIGSPGIDITEEISVETRKMRLKLIFEELSELADAYGLPCFFGRLCYAAVGDYMNYEGGFEPDDQDLDTEVLNKVEALDALADLQYVLSGSVIETGLVEVFDDAMEEVHDSNMSKFTPLKIVASATQDRYKRNGVETEIIEINGLHVIKRMDGKVLKSIYYRPANFKQFIPE